MDAPSPLTRRTFLAGLVAAPVLAACGTGGDDVGSDTTEAPSTAPPITEATTTTPPPPPRAPLTGEEFIGDPALLGRPALVVKIDNADGSGSNNARPQAGLNQADIVIEEMVEGGVTRFAAVFHSRDAEPVGPVRSVRITDLGYLGLFNNPLLAWSGGNAVVAPAIRNSGLITDVGFDVASSAYRRTSERRAPHNLMSATPALFASAPAGAGPPPPVFEYGDPSLLAAPAWQPATTAHIQFSTGPGSAPVDYRWGPDIGAWRRLQKGTPHVDASGAEVTATNVVLQFVPYGIDGVDSAGNPVPEGQLLGSGSGLALVGGQVAEIAWSHPANDAPIVFTLPATGEPLRLLPGRTWWALNPPGTASVA